MEVKMLLLNPLSILGNSPHSLSVIDEVGNPWKEDQSSAEETIWSFALDIFNNQ